METTVAAARERQLTMTAETERSEIQTLEQVARWGDAFLARLDGAAADTVDAMADAVAFMDWLDSAKADLRWRAVKPVWETARELDRRDKVLKVSAQEGGKVTRKKAAKRAETLKQKYQELRARSAYRNATPERIVEVLAAAQKKGEGSSPKTIRRLIPETIAADKIAHASKLKSYRRA